MAEQLNPMLSLRGLMRRFGGLTAVDAIDLDLAKGELISIIGPNGAGKTTLFNLVTGLDRPDAGAVSFEGRTSRGCRRSGSRPKALRVPSSSAASSAISA